MRKTVTFVFTLLTLLVLSSVSVVYPEDLDKTKDLFTPVIERAAKDHGVNKAIIRAIIMAESTFNPKAVSKRGAKGLMQLMPRTAKSLGVKNSFDPAQNVHGGVKYFRQLLDKFGGNVDFALAAYNAGSKNVYKHKGVPPFGVTKRYIKKVKEYREFYKGEYQ